MFAGRAFVRGAPDDVGPGMLTPVLPPLDTEPDGETLRAPGGFTPAGVRWAVLAVALLVPVLVSVVIDWFGTSPRWLFATGLGCCAASCAIVAVLGVLDARRRRKNPVVALGRGLWAAIRWFFSMVP